MYFDAHCHLMEDSVYTAAQQAGVGYFIVNTVHPAEWERAVQLQHRISGISVCAGVHPWYLSDLPSDWASQMEHFLIQHPDAMIGEIGLDKTKPFLDQQIAVFLRCLEIAERYNRKVHIHCMKAWDDMLECLGQYRSVQPLFHRFNGAEFVMSKLRLKNAFFSITGGHYADLIPENRLLVETDAPDGLKSPEAIPDLVAKLHLNPERLEQNFWEFLNG